MTGALRIWWVRHGPTHAATMTGWTDAPADLSDLARLDRLSTFLPPAPVLSSDLVRATTTAAAIAAGRPQLAPRRDLREIHFGAWEGRRFEDVHAETPEAITDFWEQPGRPRPPGGESWDDLRERVGGEVAALIRDRRGDLIVVAHFGVILTELERALAKPAPEIFAQTIDNLSVTRIAHDPAGARRAELINHLP